MARSWHSRRSTRLWALFALFIALPSVALAVAGFRAISADRIERADRFRAQAEAAAMLVDGALASELGRAVSSSAAAIPSTGHIRVIRDRRVLVFPDHHIFVADFGAPLRADLVRASDASPAGEVPAEIIEVIAAGSGPRARMPEAIRRLSRTLDQLRSGAWWLHLDQRKAYDAELARLLVLAGARDSDADTGLDQLSRIARAVSAMPSWEATAGAEDVGRESGIELVTWSHTGSGNGVPGIVMDRMATALFLNTLLATTAGSQGFDAEVRGRRVGTPDGSRAAGQEPVFEVPLKAITGATLRLARRVPETPVPWGAYGMTILPLVVLSFGLVMTTRVVRREIELARRQDEFTAAVTHEFKSPIASLRLILERLTSGRVERAATAEYHHAMEGEIERLDALVTRLLDLQAVRANATGRRRVDVHPGELVNAAVEQARPLAASKNTTLDVTVSPNLPNLTVDQTAMTDAVFNVIDNAIKYSARGSRIVIEAGATGRDVLIVVRDQGVGIHPDDLARVFEPYYRGRLGDRENVRGTGLGLALVQAAAISHGGSVDVVSTPDEGSQFTLRLPGTTRS